MCRIFTRYLYLCCFYATYTNCRVSVYHYALGEIMEKKPIEHLLEVYGSYKAIAEVIGKSYKTAYAMSFRPVPYKHLDKLIEASQGRLNKEMLRP